MKDSTFPRFNRVLSQFFENRQLIGESTLVRGSRFAAGDIVQLCVNSFRAIQLDYGKTVKLAVVNGDFLRRQNFSTAPRCKHYFMGA